MQLSPKSILWVEYFEIVASLIPYTILLVYFLNLKCSLQDLSFSSSSKEAGGHHPKPGASPAAPNPGDDAGSWVCPCTWGIITYLNAAKSPLA